MHPHWALEPISHAQKVLSLAESLPSSIEEILMDTEVFYDLTNDALVQFMRRLLGDFSRTAPSQTPNLQHLTYYGIAMPDDVTDPLESAGIRIVRNSPGWHPSHEDSWRIDPPLGFSLANTDLY